jgi:serine/threonine protein kinase
MLTGELAFTAPTLVDLMFRMNTPPTPPSQLEPSIPPDLEEVVLRCLQRDPSLRFQTAVECAEALGAFATGSVRLLLVSNPLRRPEATSLDAAEPESDAQLPSTLPPPPPQSSSQIAVLPEPRPSSTMRLPRAVIQEVTGAVATREAERARARRRRSWIGLALLALVVLAGLAWALRDGAWEGLVAHLRSLRPW